MRRTQKWLNNIIREGWAEIEWATNTTVQLRWYHREVPQMIWIV